MQTLKFDFGAFFLTSEKRYLDVLKGKFLILSENSSMKIKYKIRFINDLANQILFPKEHYCLRCYFSACLFLYCYKTNDNNNNN